MPTYPTLISNNIVAFRACPPNKSKWRFTSELGRPSLRTTPSEDSSKALKCRVHDENNRRILDKLQICIYIIWQREKQHLQRRDFSQSFLHDPYRYFRKFIFLWPPTILSWAPQTRPLPLVESWPIAFLSCRVPVFPCFIVRVAWAN